LCGKDHAFMPIVVKVVTGAEFDNWLAAGGHNNEAANVANSGSTSDTVIDAIVPAAVAAETTAAPAEFSSKTWTKDELMSLGEEVSTRCVACHGAQGKGLPGAFPAIAGSPVANGPVDAHIDLVMFGKTGTAMVAFGNQLNDEELAAIITYQRNSFGNDAGDIVLPADIKAKR